jgi:hypothetical protein
VARASEAIQTAYSLKAGSAAGKDVAMDKQRSKSDGGKMIVANIESVPGTTVVEHLKA